MQFEAGRTQDRTDFRSASDNDLILRLRAATAGLHERLETALDLLPPRKERFVAALQGFLGFHRTWEPAVAAWPELAACGAGRSRLHHLEADLAAMGCAPADLASAPRCDVAAALAVSRHAALGSLYVMEGSTLGGQVLTRALTGVDWAPPGGLSYFNPYGARTGEMWRSFCRNATALTSPEAGAEVEAGAQACFTVLTDWLAPKVCA